MSEGKYLVERCGTQTGSPAWTDFDLPELPMSIEVKYISEAKMRVREMLALCIASIEISITKGTSGWRASDIHQERLYASASVQIGALYIKWNIVKVTENGERVTPAIYCPSEYVKNNYGVPDIKGWSAERLQFPSYGLLFAHKLVRSGDYVSHLKMDKGKPFSASMAHALLADSNVEIGESMEYIAMNEAICYYLPLKNPDCCIYRPSVFQAIDNSWGVEAEVTVEIVLAFDNFIVPMLIPWAAGGEGSYTLLDIVSDIKDALSGEYEAVDDFFKRCGNRVENESDSGAEPGFTLAAFSMDGQSTRIQITPDYLRNESLDRALTSVRIVHMVETYRPSQFEEHGCSV